MRIDIITIFPEYFGPLRVSLLGRAAERGIVADLNAGARTFKIGGALIDFSGIAAADLPSNFANGLKVRVRLNTVKNGSGAWVAIAIRAAASIG